MSTKSSIDTNTTNTTATTTVPTRVDPEQAVAFAALILADDNITVTPEKLQALLKAAGITEVEPIWTTLFANALKGKDVQDILTAVATSDPDGGEAPSHDCNSDDHNDGGSEADGMDIGADSDDDVGCFGFFD
ncbi:60S acidic ribosomal protein P1 [Didymella pomorum]|jgi:large subunit ribosomal protein LP1|uniref:Large ribosomal subunit protein P1 n=1 Tax=Didymella pomorum TaxID=749634 RepID=A0A9W8ZE71_9PLEO|nr:60S acidic ribosomal protein P1 [Didymella pomorum]